MNKKKTYRINEQNISKIRKNIPVPARTGAPKGSKGECKYPFKNLTKIGYSFEVAIDKKFNKAKNFTSMLSGTFRKLQKEGYVPKRWKITVRNINGNIGVWRIK